MSFFLEIAETIFIVFAENEKEPEMQIGFPTDVKHVAHIGWDGPSVNSPSWVYFRFLFTLLGKTVCDEWFDHKSHIDRVCKNLCRWMSLKHQSLGEISRMMPQSNLKVWCLVSQIIYLKIIQYPCLHNYIMNMLWVWVMFFFVRADSSSRRSARDPELPKSSRRHASTGSSADPERSEKSRSRRSKQSNKDLSESTRSKCASEGGGTDIPKKSRRKKSKDSADGSSRSSRTSRRGQSSKSDTASEYGSVSKSNNINNECSQTSGVNHSEGGEVKEHTGISWEIGAFLTVTLVARIFCLVETKQTNQKKKRKRNSFFYSHHWDLYDQIHGTYWLLN